MDEMGSTGEYWCHSCSQEVNPIMDVETMKCPVCRGDFIEEIATAMAPGNESPFGLGGDSDSDRALSLWAPILLGMMSNPRRRRRFRRLEFEDDDEENDENIDRRREGFSELETMFRRRNNSASIMQLLQGIRAGMVSESAYSDDDERNGERENRNRENRNRESVILINPFSQTIIVQGSYDSDNPRDQPVGSLGDYFVGPGLDLLLQHLAENDPNRYGTPPAQKEAVEALPTVKVAETLQCSVCLEDFEIGSEAKEMPCNHKFHGECIFPWLDLHSSCPVCRHQLPSDESKLHQDVSRNSDGDHNNNGESDGARGSAADYARNEYERRFSLPWPLSSLFSSSASGSQPRNENSTSSRTSSSEPSTNAPPDRTHED